MVIMYTTTPPNPHINARPPMTPPMMAPVLFFVFELLLVLILEAADGADGTEVVSEIVEGGEAKDNVNVGVAGGNDVVGGLEVDDDKGVVDFVMVSAAVGKARRCAVAASGPQWKYSYV